ncbi:hypothetical protein C8J57DRAFT_1558529 [Mycena rebaudengoi]|nr:hypothetical protein C8J57DRAFT_1558529 [Mycena rebaudengoi]
MQSSIVKLLAILSTGVWAAPLNPISSRATCNINSCVVALAPSFPTACDPASAQLGANTPFNTACLAAAAKGTTAFASVFANCKVQPGTLGPLPVVHQHQAIPQAGAPAPGSAPVPGGAPVRGSAPPVAPKKAKGAKAPAPARPRASTCDIQACVLALGPSFPLYTSFNRDCLIAAAKGTGPFIIERMDIPVDIVPNGPIMRTHSEKYLSHPGYDRVWTYFEALRIILWMFKVTFGHVVPFGVHLDMGLPYCSHSSFPYRQEIFALTTQNIGLWSAVTKDFSKFGKGQAEGQTRSDPGQRVKWPTGCGGCATQFGVTEPSSNTNTNSQDAGAARIAIN